jgi:hypothetical protein
MSKVNPAGSYERSWVTFFSLSCGRHAMRGAWEAAAAETYKERLKKKRQRALPFLLSFYLREQSPAKLPRCSPVSGEHRRDQKSSSPAAEV